MLGYSGKRRSAFWSLMGTLTVIIGFNGLVSGIFSQSALQLENYPVVELDDIKTTEHKNSKVAVAAKIYSDDFVKMPDDNLVVVKGKLQLIACWNDGSRQILIDWQNEAGYLKVYSNLYSDGIIVGAGRVECFQDSVSALNNLKISTIGNRITVDYYNYHFTLTGGVVRGMPTFKIKREYLPMGEDVILVGTDIKSNLGSRMLSADYILPMETALQRQPKVSGSGKFSIVLIVLGVIMFFIPESVSNSKFYKSVFKLISK